MLCRPVPVAENNHLLSNTLISLRLLDLSIQDGEQFDLKNNSTPSNSCKLTSFFNFFSLSAGISREEIQ